MISEARSGLQDLVPSDREQGCNVEERLMGMVKAQSGTILEILSKVQQQALDAGMAHNSGQRSEAGTQVQTREESGGGLTLVISRGFSSAGVDACEDGDADPGSEVKGPHSSTSRTPEPKSVPLSSLWGALEGVLGQVEDKVRRKMAPVMNLLDSSEGALVEEDDGEASPVGHAGRVVVTAEGHSYRGELRDGLMHGYGRLEWEEGHVYQGEFQHGETGGVGQRMWKSGHSFVGEERGSLKHGRGVFEWPEGRRYEGQFEKDMRNGFGVMLWPSGRWYIGFWRDGTKDGEGIECEGEGKVRFLTRYMDGLLQRKETLTSTSKANSTPVRTVPAEVPESSSRVPNSEMRSRRRGGEVLERREKEVGTSTNNEGCLQQGSESAQEQSWSGMLGSTRSKDKSSAQKPGGKPWESMMGGSWGREGSVCQATSWQGIFGSPLGEKRVGSETETLPAVQEKQTMSETGCTLQVKRQFASQDSAQQEDTAGASSWQSSTERSAAGAKKNLAWALEDVSGNVVAVPQPGDVHVKGVCVVAGPGSGAKGRNARERSPAVSGPPDAGDGVEDDGASRGDLEGASAADNLSEGSGSGSTWSLDSQDIAEAQAKGTNTMRMLEILQGGTLKEMVDSFDEEDEDEQAEERMLAENMALRSQERLSAGRGSASSHSSSSTASCSTRDPPGEEADAQFPPVKYKTAHVIQEASTQVHFVPQMAYLQGDDDENVHLCTPSHKAGSYEKKGSPVMGFSQESLWKASREGNAGVISHALGMGAYVGMHDEEDKGNTALHMAAAGGHLVCVGLLLGSGADACAQNDFGDTPMHAASFCGHFVVIEALAGAGGDVNAVSEDGDTPLHCSSYQGEAKACRTLIALGANVNAQSRMDKDTALHRAAFGGHLEACRVLLRCGASPTALNSDDLSPADLAEALKHCDVSEEIRLAKQRLGSEDEDHDVSL